jgi:hypothetical protein
MEFAAACFFFFFFFNRAKATPHFVMLGGHLEFCELKWAAPATRMTQSLEKSFSKCLSTARLRIVSINASKPIFLSIIFTSGGQSCLRTPYTSCICRLVAFAMSPSISCCALV